MIWQIVVKSILLCIVWQTNSGLFDVFLSLSQIDGVLRFYALHTRVFHKITKKCLDAAFKGMWFCITLTHFFWFPCLQIMKVFFLGIHICFLSSAKSQFCSLLFIFHSTIFSCCHTTLSSEKGTANQSPTKPKKSGLYGSPWSFKWKRNIWRPWSFK